MNTKGIQTLFKKTAKEEGLHFKGRIPSVRAFQEGTITFVFVNGQYNKFGWAKRTKGEEPNSRLGYEIAIKRLVRGMVR